MKLKPFNVAIRWSLLKILIPAQFKKQIEQLRDHYNVVELEIIELSEEVAKLLKEKKRLENELEPSKEDTKVKALTGLIAIWDNDPPCENSSVNEDYERLAREIVKLFKGE